MLCPFCNYSETKVVDSRDTNDGKVVRRRRECEKCQRRFSTYEELEIIRLTVIKKNQVQEEYDQDKIIAGIERALEKRPVSIEKRKKLLQEIEFNIFTQGKSEITTKEIGKIILEKLLKVDEVAYVRFASVYKSFGSIKTFRKELDKISDE